MQPTCPAIIAGDLNADASDLQACSLLQRTGWIDLGAMASRWRGVDGDYTCLAHSAHRATRRDFVFANPQAVALVEAFRVDHSSDFDVHAVLQLLIKPKKTAAAHW